MRDPDKHREALDQIRDALVEDMAAARTCGEQNEAVIDLMRATVAMFERQIAALDAVREAANAAAVEWEHYDNGAVKASRRVWPW